MEAFRLLIVTGMSGAGKTQVLRSRYSGRRIF